MSKDDSNNNNNTNNKRSNKRSKQDTKQDTKDSKQDAKQSSKSTRARTVKQDANQDAKDSNDDANKKRTRDGKLKKSKSVNANTDDNDNELNDSSDSETDDENIVERKEPIVTRSKTSSTPKSLASALASASTLTTSGRRELKILIDESSLRRFAKKRKFDIPSEDDDDNNNNNDDDDADTQDVSDSNVSECSDVDIDDDSDVASNSSDSSSSSSRSSSPLLNKLDPEECKQVKESALPDGLKSKIIDELAPSPPPLEAGEKKDLVATIKVSKRPVNKPKTIWGQELNQISRHYLKKNGPNPEFEKLLKDFQAEFDQEPGIKDIMEAQFTNEEKQDLVRLLICYYNLDIVDKVPYLQKIIDKIKESQMPKDLIQVKNRLEQLDGYSKDTLTTILKLDIPEKAKVIIYRKYQQWQELKSESNSGELRAKLKEWIDFAIRIPTCIKPLFSSHHDVKQEDHFSQLFKIKKTLDDHLYGMRKEKEEILLIMNQILNNPNNNREKNLGLVGGPGNGKTELLRSVAKACDLNFVHISLGGCHDSSYLEGTGFVYEGSQPGIIVKSLCRAGARNCIIYFDEIDKLESTERGEEVMSSLLHILDPTQNMEFRDKYLDELPIDLSQVWFMFSMNDEKRINKILLDRMHIVRVENQTKQAKLEIIKRFSIPKTLKNLGMDEKDIIFPDAVIMALINKRADESEVSDGMRTLNNDITSILRRVSILKNTNMDYPRLDLSFGLKNISFPFKITQEIMLQFITSHKKEDQVVKEMYT